MPVGSSLCYCYWRDANGLARIEVYPVTPVGNVTPVCHSHLFPRCRLLYGKQVSFLRMVLTTRSCHETRVLLVAVVVDAKPMTWTDKNMQLMWFVCLFHETACGCVDLVILSDLLMISLKSYKVLYFNLSSIFDHPDYISTDPNTSDAVAPLRLFVSLRCCGHSQRASAWWSDHWGNACIASMGCSVQ